MKCPRHQLLIRVAGVIFCLIVTGCFDSAVEHHDEVLIRVEDCYVTVNDFKQHLEISLTAYPANALRDRDILENAMSRLLNQMTDELVIRKRAEELNIEISDEELQKKIQTIKSDYPGDTFGQVLIEQSIPYGLWEKSLKKRLLLEKVVKQDLEEQVIITPEDITKFKRSKNDLPKEADNESQEKNFDDMNRKLRRKKAEQAYVAWIVQLRDRYTIYINEAKWEKLKQL